MPAKKQPDAAPDKVADVKPPLKLLGWRKVGIAILLVAVATAIELLTTRGLSEPMSGFLKSLAWAFAIGNATKGGLQAIGNGISGMRNGSCSG